MDIASLAAEMLAALDAASYVTPPMERWPDLDFTTAYVVGGEETRLRVARGERPVGRKIGYTNSALWAQFNAHEPIWAHMYAHTVHDARDGVAMQSLAKMLEPRVEPEIAFGLRGAVPIGCDDPAEVLRSVAWVARTFEIVDCHYTGWKFKGADSVVDFGHHAALVVGERREVRDADIPLLVDELRDCRVTLTRDGGVVDNGVGANALGHPALALARLADLVASQPDAPPLAAGEIITTGTLTSAPYVKVGETWRTETEGLALPPLSVTFE